MGRVVSHNKGANGFIGASIRVFRNQLTDRIFGSEECCRVDPLDRRVRSSD